MPHSNIGQHRGEKRRQREELLTVYFYCVFHEKYWRNKVNKLLRHKIGEFEIFSRLQTTGVPHRLGGFQ